MNVLARSLAEAADPVLLGERIGMTPDVWQALVLRSKAPRVLLCCARQVGKSTTTAILAVHRAVYFPGSLILVFAPSQRQALELFRSCTRLYRTLGRPVPAESENALSLTLENGSRIIALPADEKTVRGFAAVDLILVDEASRVPDELYHSVRPMLAVSAGRIVAMSTPFGRRGWFFEASRDDGWEQFRVPASECARITPEFLAEERDALGPWMFRQEFECSFEEAAGSLFDPEDLRAMFDEGVRPLERDDDAGPLHLVEGGVA